MKGCKCKDGSLFYVTVGGREVAECPEDCEVVYIDETGGEGADGRNLNGDKKKAGGVFKGFLQGLGLIGSGTDGEGEKNENCKKLQDWTGVDVCKYLKIVLIVVLVLIALRVLFAAKKLFLN